MGLQATANSFNIGTGMVGSTTQVTGVGFQPKAVLFFWTGRTETVDTQSRTDHKKGMGGYGGGDL